VSAGLAIALQNPLSNLAAWFFIVIRKPYTTGDRIRIDEHVGNIIDITLFQTTILEVGGGEDGQSTGRIVHLPNGWVFKRSVRNDTQGFDFVWAEIAVTVTFESDWRRAKEMLLEVARGKTPVSKEQAEAQMRKAAQRLAISYGFLTPVVWTKVEASGVSLIVRYPCPPRERRAVTSRIWERILVAYESEENIDFAYPTWRRFDHAAEGRGVRPTRRPGPKKPRRKPDRRSR